MQVRAVAGAIVLLTGFAPAAGAQTVAGRAMDLALGRPVGVVVVELLNGAGARVGSAVTDTSGNFRISVPSPGYYSIAAHHIAYEEYRSPVFSIGADDPPPLAVDLVSKVLEMDRIDVRVRLPRQVYHAPTYTGLYARMRALGTFGHNRVVMKDDVEFRSAMRASDLLRHWFPTVASSSISSCVPAVYWNGHIVAPSWVSIRLDTSVEDLEAIEVYDDFLMAPMPFRETNILGAGMPCAVVALWPLRPDLPGRGERK